MTKLDSIKDVGARIRWKSVLAVLFVLVVVILVFRSFPSGYAVKDDIGLRANANPDSIAVGGRTILEVEVKNMGQDDEVESTVSAKAYDERLIFANTSSTVIETVVRIGPKETRKLSFDMTVLSGALEGTYRVDVTAKAENRIEGVKVPVYINVEG